MPPRLFEFLYDLSKSQGADQTVVQQTGAASAARNGEPYGEIGLVTQKDDEWQDQTGGPRDPQPGNIPGGRRDVLRSAGFDDATLSGFYVDSGSWTVTNGALSVAAASLGRDAASVFYVDDYLPVYYELKASVQSQKPTGGWKANAYLIFDYFSPTDFKFAGIDISTNKLVMGVRDASGWRVLAQGPKQMNGGQYYQLLLTVNGTTVTLLVDGTKAFTYTYDARVIDGEKVALNKGMVGMGSDNARGIFDNVAVQVLPPQVTYDNRADLSQSTSQLDPAWSGAWQGPAATGTTGAAGTTGAVVTVRIDTGRRVASTSWVAATSTLTLAPTSFAGVMYDAYTADDYKLVALDMVGQRVVFGHMDSRRGWTVDLSVAQVLRLDTAYTLQLNLKGTSVSATLNGAFVASTAYNAGVVDGRLGLVVRSGSAAFTSVRVQTDDPAFLTTAAAPPAPVVPAVSVGDASVTEGNAGTFVIAVPVTLSEATTVTVRVPWSLSGGTAVAGTDFAASSGELVFDPGTTTLSVSIVVTGDTVVEPDETLTVLLGAPTGATVGRGTGILTIVNDDVPAAAPPAVVVPVVSIGTASVLEGRSGTQTVTVPLTLSTATTGTVTVVVTMTGLGTATAGSDHQAWSPATRTVTFAPGATAATVSVVVIADRTAEPDETVVLALSSPAGATLGTATGVLTIRDDDSRLQAASVGSGRTGGVTASGAALRRALATAVRWWVARGADPAVLRRVRVVPTAMAGADLAQAVGRTVLLDTDAAGWGWSLTARPRRMDLPSVLAHELGHVLGHDHARDGVMADRLSPGASLLTTTPSVAARRRQVAGDAAVSLTAMLAAPAPALLLARHRLVSAAVPLALPVARVAVPLLRTPFPLTAARQRPVVAPLGVPAPTGIPVLPLLALVLLAGARILARRRVRAPILVR